MTHRPAVFAIPGDIETLTGGYIYERRLLLGLRKAGHNMAHLQLGDSFPDPSPADRAQAIDALTAVKPERALILDGLVYGSIDPAGLARVTAPIVAMIHHPLARETGLNSERQEHLYRTERANLRLAQQVLVPSGHTASILTTDYGVEPGRITIAPPGTDRPSGRPAPIDPPLILSVGIQHPRKGHDILLRALARIHDTPWQAVIVGSAHDPAHAKDLAQIAKDLGLSDRVTLAGRVPGETLAAYYRQASIFALATRYEGYGIVFDEALSCGLPIISCRTGAVPDTVPDTAGLLVPPDDHTALANALHTLLHDGPMRQRMAQAAAEAGRLLPGWDDTARIASGVLNKLTR
ncbi:glycosyltransferase family 4 protein [Gymnodinialimonas sp. 2305UL16-5]|uniref:glycosyltransferase family 4 protein n=1 Tax=Gymnodinialimonas mytili TaxID=3126503 RepID=UPI0030A90F7C